MAINITFCAMITSCPTLAYAICAPPRASKADVKDQIVSMLRFRATPVPEPNQFPKEYDDDDDTDIFLRLQ